MADDDILEAEQFDTYIWIPEEQAWRPVNAPSATPESLEDVTAGAFFQRGANVYRSVDSAYVGRIAHVSGSTIERGSQGTVLLNNRVPRHRIDDPMGADRQPRMVIKGDLTALGDTTENPINRVISLAPRGDLVYVNDAIGAGKARYQRVIAPAAGIAAPLRLSNGMRLATAEELIIRGLAGYLARNATAAIERAKLEGIDRGDGTKTIDGSEIVRILAANLEYETVVSYVLGDSNPVVI